MSVGRIVAGWVSATSIVLEIGAGAAPETPQAAPQAVAAPVLQMARGRNWEGGVGTIWRYYEVWSTDVVRTDAGKLVRVDPLKPRMGFDGAKLFWDQGAGRKAKDVECQIQEATKITGSAFPPSNWTAAEFDDGQWVRTATPMGCSYRSLSLVCLRGKFTVNDPAQVEGLSLDAKFQGGAVFHLNGQEIGRASMPQGKIDQETLADDYPKEAFVTAEGGLLPGSDGKDADIADRAKKRYRQASLQVPAAALRKGINVLAIEVHRAPAAEAMYTRVSPARMGYGLSDHYGWFWNRASLEDLKLTAKAGKGVVEANFSRPAAVQVWNQSIWERVDPRCYGDPGDPLRPVRIAGARNGTYSDQVVVSSAAPIKNLKVEAQGAGARAIPAAWLRVSYPSLYKVWGGFIFEQIEDALPADPPPIQPVWVTVDIPQVAQAGEYTGTLTISAEGLAPVSAPIEVHVSDWRLPDPRTYVTHMAFIQSPDSVALTYGVPMWSKAHWSLIDQSFKVLGTVATKELNLPLVRRTHFGNEHGMVWFVKAADGTYKPYLDIAEKYIDTGVKHLGKVPVVCFYVIEADADGCPWVTEFDPESGNLKNIKAPPWGTDEAHAFWKPVFEGLRKILAKHGMEGSMVLGYHAAGGNGPEARAELIQDMKLLAPEARWVRVGHTWGIGGKDKLEKGPNGNPWARVALVSGNYGVGWDPDTDKPFYGWQNPYPVTAYTRDACFRENSQAWVYRLAPETVLLSGQRTGMPGWGVCDVAGLFGRDTFLGCRGFGPLGADFWVDVVGRFNDPSAGLWDPRCCWSTVQLNNGGVIRAVGKGIRGPVPSIRTEALREGLQEAEARVFCQNALLDEGLAARLGPDLAKRCKDVCDNRTRALRYLSEFRAFGSGKGQSEQHYIFNPKAWRDLSLQLYEMAAEVGKALGKP